MEIIERHIINKEVQFARPEMRMITAKTIFVAFFCAANINSVISSSATKPFWRA